MATCQKNCNLLRREAKISTTSLPQRLLWLFVNSSKPDMSAFSNALQFLYQSSFSPLRRHRRGEEAVNESDSSDNSGGGEDDKIGSNGDDDDDDNFDFGENNNGDDVAEAVIVGVGVGNSIATGGELAAAAVMEGGGQRQRQCW